ncbi:MAG: hypothetical protein ACRDF0_05030 [Candidatus Limnocylindria bacterium]
MPAYFILIAAAVAVAALSGLPTAWDGGYIFYRAVDDQAPYVSNGRLINAALQVPTLLWARFSGDAQGARHAFSLAYAAVPLLALSASWWLVRDRDRSLMVWPALGIGLATLGGQAFFASEAIMVVQLFWPLLLAVMVGAGPASTSLAAVLAVVLAFSHPTAPLLLGIGAGAGFLLGAADERRRRRDWRWSLALFAAAGTSLVWSAVRLEPHAAESMTPEAIGAKFAGGVLGPPLISLTLAAFAGLALLAPLARSHLAPLPRALAPVLAAAAGAVLLPWAADPLAWRHADDFRAWALFTSLPIGALGLADHLARRRAAREDGGEWTARRRVCLVAAAAMLSVVGLQSAGWAALEGRLAESIRRAQASCVERSSLSWLDGGPLDHWSLTARSLVSQGRDPRTIVLFGRPCAWTALANGIPIVGFDLRDPDEGWFRLRPLYDSLREQLGTGGSAAAAASSRGRGGHE